MKKILICCLLLIFFACKKKEADPPPPATTGTPVPVRTNAMTATLNGSVWTVTGNQSAAANIETVIYNSNPRQFVLAGRTHTTLNRNSIHLGFTYTTGVVNLAPMSAFYAMYIDSTGSSYSATSGTMNISLLDTSHKRSPACDKFKATFSFVTHAIGNRSYTVSGGFVDYVAK